MKISTVLLAVEEVFPTLGLPYSCVCEHFFFLVNRNSLGSNTCECSPVFLDMKIIC